MLLNNCKTKKTQHLGTGGKSGCIEGLTVLHFLAKDGFFFTEENIMLKATWKTAIQNKDIVPLYELYELSNENTEAQKYETRNFVHQTQKEVKKLKSENYLTLAQHRALKSYQDSGVYTRIFEVTEKLEVLGVIKEEKLYGQKLKNFDVSMRNNTVSNKPATTTVLATFNDFEEFEDDGFIIIPDFDPIIDLNGITNLSIDVLTETSASITFKCYAGYGRTNFASLSDATLTYVTDSGTTVVTTLTYNATTEVYTLATAATFTTGTLTSDVFESDDALYELLSTDVTI